MNLKIYIYLIKYHSSNLTEPRKCQLVQFFMHYVKSTFQGIEISRLLGQYIYVDSENRAFISGIEQQE